MVYHGHGLFFAYFKYHHSEKHRKNYICLFIFTTAFSLCPKHQLRVLSLLGDPWVSCCKVSCLGLRAQLFYSGISILIWKPRGMWLRA